jgi:hypothetical protein
MSGKKQQQKAVGKLGLRRKIRFTLNIANDLI